MKLLYLVCGGAIGTILRYCVYLLYEKRNFQGFPYATITVNLIGSLIIGIAFGILQKTNMPINLKIFLFVGILGSFTTFSTYAIDALQLILSNQNKTAIVYILASNIFGLLLAYGGYIAGSSFTTK
ncbi:MAG: fluoride efflux transporter CrcB [Bacteroidales bacterium]